VNRFQLKSELVIIDSSEIAQEGCDVICADIDLDGAQMTSNEIKKLGRQSRSTNGG
jgi:hypothetical protein